MYQFLEIHNLSEFTQGEMDNLSRPVCVKEGASVINLPKQHYEMVLLVNSAKHLRTKWYQDSYNLIEKSDTGRTLNSFLMMSAISCVPKLRIVRKKNYRSLSQKHRCKNPQ